MYCKWQIVLPSAFLWAECPPVSHQIPPGLFFTQRVVAEGGGKLEGRPCLLLKTRREPDAALQQVGSVGEELLAWKLCKWDFLPAVKSGSMSEDV